MISISSTNGPYDMIAPSMKSSLRKGSLCVHSFIERANVRTKTVRSKTNRQEKATPVTDETGYQYTVRRHGTRTHNEP